MIDSLQKLRLLPPPCNELVPLMSTIAIFSILSLLLDPKQKGDVLSLFREKLVWGSFTVYMAVYWGYSLLIHIAEHSFPETLRNFKIQPKVPIASWSEVFKMVPLVLLNQVLLGPPLLKALFYWLSQCDVDVFSWPTVPRFASMMLLCVLCAEAWFYSAHRLMHTPFLYKNVHYLHHYYKAPSCLESVYVHPVEFILNSFTVMLVGPFVVRAPLVVAISWIALGTFLQVHDHSGYWFPFLPRVLMHDYHHQKIRCCYGILGLLDKVFGTDIGLDQFVKEHEESSMKPSRKAQ